MSLVGKVNSKQALQGVLAIRQGIDGEKGEQGEISLAYADSHYSPAIISTATGKVVAITDSAEAPLVNLKAHGDSWQNQYEGHQLFDISQVISISSSNGSSITRHEDGSITVVLGEGINSEEAGGNTTLQTYSPNLVVGETYTLNANADSRGIYLVGVNQVWDWGTSKTITDDMLSSKVFWYAKGVGTTCVIKDIVICDGTEVKPWEPYFGGQPSPSMEYPQPIESLENVEVKVLGGNLVDFGDELVIYKNNSSNFDYSIVDDNVYFFEKVDQLSAWANENIIRFEGEDGKQYTISADLKCGTATTFGIGFMYSDGSTSSSPRYTNTEWYHVSATSEVGKTVIGYGFTYGKNGTGYVRDFTLAIGTEEIPFSPYKEPQTLTIPYVLPKGDKVEYASGNRLQGHNIKVFDGTEDWYQYGKCVALLNWDNFETPQHGLDKIGAFCNIAVEGTDANENLIDNTFTTYHDKEVDWIIFHVETTVADWKSYLAEQYANGTPVYVQYPLAEPIVTDLTEEDIEAYRQLNMNYPTTTILSNAELEVEYVADTKLYIDKKFEELAVAIVSQ